MEKIKLKGIYLGSWLCAYLHCQHLIWEPAERFQFHSLLMQLGSSGTGADCRALGAHVEDLDETPGFTLLSPSCCGHRGSEPAEKLSLLYVCITAFQINTFLKRCLFWCNKTLNSLHCFLIHFP